MQDLTSSLIESPQELFEALMRIQPGWDVRVKYGVLREVLNVGVDQQLANEPTKFSGLYAKIDFLLKRHQHRLNDTSLHFALNDVRHRLMDLRHTDDHTLSECWPTDLRAVASFMAVIYGEKVPEKLRTQFPLHVERQRPQRLSDEGGKAISFFRCIVTDWDDTVMHATREDNGERVTVDYAHPLPYLRGDWSYIGHLLRKNMAVNVVRPRLADDGKSVRPEILVIEPDYLVNVTAIAGCFDACGTSPLADLLRRISPYEQSIPALLGNFAGQLLDEVAYGKQIPYSESIRTFFRTNALSFATCDDLTADPAKARDFHLQAQQQKKHIDHLLHDVYRQGARAFQSDEVMLEPSFLSDMLGIQGRMDFLDLSLQSVIEQKSGKCQWAPGAPSDRFAGSQTPHVVQLLLYRAWLHYVRGLPYEKMQAALLYSRYADGFDYVNSAPGLLFEAFRVRNQLAWAETHYAEGGMQCLATLTPEKVFPQAQGALWMRYKRPQIESLLTPIRQASELERAYYFRFLQFIANEHALSRIGNRTKENAGFAATWNASLDDKLDAGNIYEGLTLEPQVHDEAVADIILHFPPSEGRQSPDADSSNFRTGDIVFVYPYEPGHNPEATRSILFRGTLMAQHKDHLVMHLRNAQTSPRVFEFFNRKGMLWAMEHDFMEASYGSLYRGMHAFLSAPKHRRDLLLGQRRPEVDRSIRLKGDYGNEEFNALVLRARQARDLYLLIGPPGTGKTSYGMKNLLLEELRDEAAQVLLLSYTNRAVDEICSKLEEEGIDYLRLGSEAGCEERYRPHLLTERMQQASNLAEVRQVVQKVRVVCGTTTSMSAGMALFKLKEFDLAIVDEASQILEPHIIGLLSAHRSDGHCCIRRFVLIGDEKQLPAVVQQGFDESAVSQPELKAIGLNDCRQSLFERLLHLYAYDGQGRLRPEVCHLLTHQGRMHRDIAQFPSTHFYGGQLEVVPLPHQTEALPPAGPADDWMNRLLFGSRVAFLSCLPDPSPSESDKVNTREAQLVATLVKRIYDRCPKAFDPLHTVGVIVPYRNQISTIRSLIDRHGIGCLHHITIDTVERYQGSQRDVIIYSFTAKRKYQLQFLTSNEYVDERDGAVIDRKLNVAMTRARKHLLLVGNAALLGHDLTFRRLIGYTREQGTYRDCSEQDCSEQDCSEQRLMQAAPSSD